MKLLRDDVDVLLTRWYADIRPFGNGAGSARGDDSDSANSLATFESFLRRRLVDGSSQHESSTLRECLKLVNEYHQTHNTSSPPDPVSELPPTLTYDTGASTTTDNFTSVETAKSIPTTTDTGVPHNDFEIGLADVSEDFDNFEFTNWFNDHFSQNKTNSLNYPLDPGNEGRMLWGG